MDAQENTLGGQGELTRSDLVLIRQALRQDWPIPPEVKRKILQRAVDYIDREHEDGASAPDRIVIGAMRALAAFCNVSLKQQALDLARQKLEGKKADVPLADLVAEAEKRAEARKREREKT